MPFAYRIPYKIEACMSHAQTPTPPLWPWDHARARKREIRRIRRRLQQHWQTWAVAARRSWEAACGVPAHVTATWRRQRGALEKSAMAAPAQQAHQLQRSLVTFPQHAPWAVPLQQSAGRLRQLLCAGVAEMQRDVHTWCAPMTSRRFATSHTPTRARGPSQRRWEPWQRVALWGFSVGAALLTARLLYCGVHRYATADHLPSHFFRVSDAATATAGGGSRAARNALWAGGARLRGIVVHVGDGDNFRVLHTPFLTRWWTLLRARWNGGRVPLRGSLSTQTIHVRLAGIDAPECAHFGAAGQKYGPEARQWLTNWLHHRTVHLQMYRRDQYGRVVAHVWRPADLPLLRWLLPCRNVSLEMVRAGWAEVYRGTGASYGGMRDALEVAEMRALRRGLGMWQQQQRRNSVLRGNWWRRWLGWDTSGIASAKPLAARPTDVRRTPPLPQIVRPADYKRALRGHAMLPAPAAIADSTAAMNGLMRSAAGARATTEWSYRPAETTGVLRPRVFLRAVSASASRLWSASHRD